MEMYHGIERFILSGAIPSFSPEAAQPPSLVKAAACVWSCRYRSEHVPPMKTSTACITICEYADSIDGRPRQLPCAAPCGVVHSWPERQDTVSQIVFIVEAQFFQGGAETLGRARLPGWLRLVHWTQPRSGSFGGSEKLLERRSQRSPIHRVGPGSSGPMMNCAIRGALDEP